ncbi:hypothetical protein [Streptosporangium lutulentum]|uniref:Uncharacterized protein n=1 Tax=Streptosporangium lutulentum TaxID=1461250 RepID=A0ABT9QUA6_9ACTN|nr:hypothetical protein [Streptosporangium lutulentum]MDP9850318.1 hypothetical protein [Streptosporangium lutulentum]
MTQTIPPTPTRSLVAQAEQTLDGALSRCTANSGPNQTRALIGIGYALTAIARSLQDLTSAPAPASAGSDVAGGGQ